MVARAARAGPTGSRRAVRGTALQLEERPEESAIRHALGAGTRWTLAVVAFGSSPSQANVADARDRMARFGGV